MAKITRVDQTVPTIKTKKKVAAYARISMESERMNHSLSAQISYYSSLIQKNPDWQYAGVFADDGISGTGIAKRVEFKRMIEAADNGEIDIILTKSIQRFATGALGGLKDVSPAAIMKEVLKAGLDINTNYLYREFVNYGADKAFWSMVKQGTGYDAEQKDIAQLATHLILTAATRTMRLEYLAGLDGWISSPHQAFCYDFISDWLHSDNQEQLSEIAKAVEDELKLPQRFMKLEVSDLVDTEIFPCLDEVILIKLMTEISDHIIDVDSIKKTVEKRRTTVGYAQVNDYYEGILQVANMQAFYKEHTTGFHSAEAKKVWKEYTSEYYMMDTYYRLFHKSYGESLKSYNSDLHDLFRSVMEKVEGLYKNWFLGQLGGNWSAVCSDELAKYGRILEVPQQVDFYKNRIQNADSRVFVVISDALRYEVAASLTEQLRRETQADVKLQDVQGIFPTITKFGMAALLPHKELEVELYGDVLKVMVDGVSTDAGYRDKVLKTAKPNSVAIKYNDLVSAKRADRSAMVKGMDVVYIYHDTIDEASHTLLNITKKYEVDPAFLHLEITESAYTESFGQITSTVEELRKWGFPIEMDDFGSGYSSLNMFSQMKLDILKLDMKFVQNETEKSLHQSILSDIINMAHRMCLKVVAEGVERKNQVDRLRETGCDYVQGYYFAKPMPAGEFEQLLKQYDVDISSALHCLDESNVQRLLIVDEDAVYRNNVRELFAKEYQVLEAYDRESALEQIQASGGKEISAIILSATLPENSATFVLKTIRQNPEFWNVPVLAILPVPNRDRKGQLPLALETDDFLCKCHPMFDLRRRIEHLIDIAELQKRENRLTDEVNRDPLTGLLNRRGLQSAMDSLRESDLPMAVCMFDLDNLKDINDTFGHNAGDQMIRAFSELISQKTRREDVLCRYGGDEFVLLLMHITNTDAVIKKITDICREFLDRITDEPFNASCSAGITICKTKTEPANELIGRADQALYRAKRDNKGGCCLWEDEKYE